MPLSDCGSATTFQPTDASLSVPGVAFAASSVVMPQTSGAALTFPALQATWSLPTNPYVVGIQFEYTPTSFVGSTKLTAPQRTDALKWITTDGIATAGVYACRWRACGVNNTVGSWSAPVSITITAALGGLGFASVADIIAFLNNIKPNLWRFAVFSVAGGAALIDPFTDPPVTGALSDQLRAIRFPGNSATPKAEVLGRQAGAATRDGAAYNLSFDAYLVGGSSGTLRAGWRSSTNTAISGITDQAYAVTGTRQTFTWNGISSDDPNFYAPTPNTSLFRLFVNSAADLPAGSTLYISNIQIQGDNYFDQQGVVLPWRPAIDEDNLLAYNAYLTALQAAEFAAKPNQNVVTNDEGNGLKFVPNGPIKLLTEASTTRTLKASDDGAEITFTNAAGCTVTLPSNATAAIKTKSQVLLRRATGAGPITIVAGSGATLVGPPGCLFTLTSEEGEATVRKKTTNGWEWIELVGNPINVGGATVESGAGVPTRGDRTLGSEWRPINGDGAPWTQTRALGMPSKAAICFAIDVAIGTPNATQFAALQAGVNAVLDGLSTAITAGADYDLCAIGWGAASHATTSLTKRAATASDVTALKAFVSGLTLISDRGDPRDGAAVVSTFYAATAATYGERLCFWISDGDSGSTPSPANVAAAAATLAAMACVRVYSIQSTEIPAYPSGIAALVAFDNTPADGVPGPMTDAASITNPVTAALVSNAYNWRKLSIVSDIQSAGASLAGVKALNFGAGVSVNVTPCGVATVDVSLDTDATLAANSDDKIATQKATKTYVDNKVAGLSWKQAVRAGATANITLSGAQTIDGVSVVAGDRVLVKSQSTASQNGIYLAASAGWTRAADADSGTELVNASCYISEGATLADTQWTCSTNAPITVGSTSLAFAQLTSGGGALQASNNLSDLANAATARTNLGVYSTSQVDAAIAAASLAASPATAIFTNVAAMPYRTLLPPSLTGRNTGFPGSDMSTFNTTTESTPVTPTVSGGSVTVANTSGAGRTNLYNHGSDIVAPQRFVSVGVTGKTASPASYDDLGVGLIKDANNYIQAFYRRTTGQAYIAIKNAGTGTQTAFVTIGTLTGDFQLGFSIIGNKAVMWYNKGQGWTVGTSADITAQLNFKATTYTLWKPGFEVSTPSTGNSTWVLNNFSYGAFGGIAIRDPTIVTFVDGSPKISSGKVYLTATVAGPTAEAYWGVFTLDLTSYALDQVGVVMVNRASAVQSDLGGQIIDNNDGTFRVVTCTWGNGFGGVLAVQYGASSSNLLSGVNVLAGQSTVTLPSTPSLGGVYDANLIKISSTWYMAYTSTTDTNFTTPQVDFHPVLASAPDVAGSPGATWTLVAEDPSGWYTEGTKFANIGGTIYIVAGNPISFRLYDGSLNYLGILKALSNGNLNTQPHAALFKSGSTYYNLTFDGYKYNSASFTWGNLYVQTASTL